jgi:large subunit ribosomal protein L46
VLTRTLTPFENAFFFYQKRLDERLVLPFRHTLYFKERTATELDWEIKYKERGKIAAHEIGRYYAQGRNQWNDELLVGSTLSDESRIRDMLLKNAEVRVTEDGDVAKPDEIVPADRPMDRITEADKTNDVRRLDRKLENTLYLIVRDSSGRWLFPSGDVPTDENLHEVSTSMGTLFHHRRC